MIVTQSPHSRLVAEPNTPVPRLMKNRITPEKEEVDIKKLIHLRLNLNTHRAAADMSNAPAVEVYGFMNHVVDTN